MVQKPHGTKQPITLTDFIPSSSPCHPQTVYTKHHFNDATHCPILNEPPDTKTQQNIKRPILDNPHHPKPFQHQKNNYCQTNTPSLINFPVPSHYKQYITSTHSRFTHHPQTTLAQKTITVLVILASVFNSEIFLNCGNLH